MYGTLHYAFTKTSHVVTTEGRLLSGVISFFKAALPAHNFITILLCYYQMNVIEKKISL